MDEYTIQLLHLKIFQRLLDDIAPQWCEHNPLAPFLEHANTLMAALEVAFGTTEMEMRLHAKELYWIQLPRWVQLLVTGYNRLGFHMQDILPLC